MPDSVVAGAGLAGLVAARHLASAGADVTVYERRDEVGGRVRSRDRDGFALDRGFQVLLTGYPAVEREPDLDALSLRRDLARKPEAWFFSGPSPSASTSATGGSPASTSGTSSPRCTAVSRSTGRCRRRSACSRTRSARPRGGRSPSPPRG